MDDDQILSTRGSRFRWIDPPTEYTQDSYMGCYTADKQHGCSITSDRPEDHCGSSDLDNAVGRTVRFKSVEANGAAALFLKYSTKVDIPSCTLPNLIATLCFSVLDPNLSGEYTESLSKTNIMDYSTSLHEKHQMNALLIKSLRAISAILDLYSDWPGATMSISITKQPMGPYKLG